MAYTSLKSEGNIHEEDMCNNSTFGEWTCRSDLLENVAVRMCQVYTCVSAEKSAYLYVYFEVYE